LFFIGCAYHKHLWSICAVADKRLKSTFDGRFYLNVICKNAVFPFLQLIPSPGEARGWGVVEAPSYEEGVGVDGKSQGFALQKRTLLFGSFRKEQQGGALKN